MLLDFIKKRWFTLALLLILFIAVLRKNLRCEMDPKAPAVGQSKEKFTDEGASAKGAALLNLGGDGSAQKLRMPEIDETTAVAFLKRFGHVAVAEQEKFGMPASVLLACAYVNSFSGRRNCALEANNYLAIRCTEDWNGPTANYSGACFRQYNTAWESIRDFNNSLHQNNWYIKLKKSAGNDWKAWVKGLAKHEVSDVENFEAELKEVIQAYRLFELDQ